MGDKTRGQGLLFIRDQKEDVAAAGGNDGQLDLMGVHKR